MTMATTTTKPVVHGMLVGGLFSSIFGTIAPGCVYVNQSFDFVSPVWRDDIVRARLEIIRIRPWPARLKKSGIVVTCHTEIHRLPIIQHIGKDDNNKDKDKHEIDSPKESSSAILAVRGQATVWLQAGYEQKGKDC